MKGRSNYAYEKLASCTAEPVKLDSYGLVSHIPYTPLPHYLPQLPVWDLRNISFLTHFTGHTEHSTLPCSYQFYWFGATGLPID